MGKKVIPFFTNNQSFKPTYLTTHETFSIYLYHAFYTMINAQVVTSISGLLVHFPFTNISNISGNANLSAIEATAIPTLAGGWFSSFPTNSTRSVGSFGSEGALSITGVDNVAANVSIPSAAFTVSFWQNLTDGDGLGRVMLGSVLTPNATDWQFYYVYNFNNSSRISVTNFYVFDNSTNIGLSQNIDTQISGVWNFFTYTWSDADNALKLYLNGVLVNTVTSNLTLREGNQLYIGGYPTATADKGKGRLDEISVFNRALTAQEVATLYNRCRPIVELSRTQPAGPSVSACANSTYNYAITLAGALSGYWRRQDVLGTTGILTFAGSAYSATALTTTGHVLNIRYIASNECVAYEEFNFNSIQTSASAIPEPYLQPYNSSNTSTVLGCTPSGYRLHLLGNNIVNSTYELWKYNEGNLSPTNITPTSNQFAINALNISQTNRTLNMGTFVGYAINACGTGTTPPVLIRDEPLSFTGDFLRFLPSSNELVPKDFELLNDINTNEFFYKKTVTGVALGSTITLDAEIAVATANASRSWLKNSQTFTTDNPVPLVLTITNFGSAGYATYRLRASNVCGNVTYNFDFIVLDPNDSNNNNSGNNNNNNNSGSGNNGTTTGVTYGKNYWKIYPNPVENKLITIEIPSHHTPTVLEIINIQGVKLAEYLILESVNQIELPLQPGGYIFKINESKKLVFVE